MKGIPGSLAGKEATCNAGDAGRHGLTSGREDPLEVGTTTHSSILPGEFYGQRERGGL